MLGSDRPAASHVSAMARNCRICTAVCCSVLQTTILNYSKTTRKRTVYRKEVDSITWIFTRAEKTRTASICNKSAITDHVCNENHVIDWENAKVIDRESDKAGRWRTWIKMRGATNWATYGTSFYTLTTGTGSQSWWRLPTWSRNVDKQYVSWLF